MAGGYTTPAGDGLGPLIRALEAFEARLSELETPTGTSANSLVAQVQEAIATINTTVIAAIESLSYTAVEIDAKIASPGAIAPTTVTASGEVSGNHATFAGGVNSVDVYNRLLTYGGPYSSQYIHSDGSMGYVPSSRLYKQDIESWAFDPVVLSYLRVVTYRYIDAVANLGDDAEHELGLIAEEVHDLGLTWLVDYRLVYTEDGAQAVPPYQGEREMVPFSVKYERVALVLIVWAQSIEARLDAAGI